MKAITKKAKKISMRNLETMLIEKLERSPLQYEVIQSGNILTYTPSKNRRVSHNGAYILRAKFCIFTPIFVKLGKQTYRVSRY